MSESGGTEAGDRGGSRCLPYEMLMWSRYPELLPQANKAFAHYRW
jgi:hypothetical protein